MVAVKRDLYIEQGATFTLGFNWYMAGEPDEGGNPTQGDPFELAGASGRMQIRPSIKKPVYAAVTTDDGDGIVFGELGRIDITFTDVKTDLIISDGVYDLEVVMADGVVFRVLQGGVTCNLNVTRDVP